MHDLILTFSTLRIQDWLDIAINAFILYRLYVLLRGSIPFRILMIVAGLWFARKAAEVVGLILTGWALEGLTAVAALVVIVVFRNEIRQVFQVQPWTRLVWGRFADPESPPNAVLAKTLFEMGEQRIGGLVVLQRKDDLSAAIATRVEWDARLSREMLLSIFWKQNPVHDGAAILTGNRVSAVRGILPLTRRMDLPGYLGTRHRAAIGISETTDACALVVSEETGRVSGAVRGVLQELYHPDALFEWLDDVFPQGEKENLSLWSTRRVHTLIAAFICLVLVVAAWFTVTRGRVVVASRDIPVEVLHAGDGQEIVSMQPHTVTLRVRGSEVLMSRLKEGDVRVSLDLRDLGVGLTHVNLGPEQIMVPAGIILEKAMPDTVSVNVDVILDAGIPVQVDWVGRLPEGVRVTEIVTKPEILRVRGRSALLNEIPTMYTAPVDIGDAILKETVFPQVIFPDGVSPLEDASDRLQVRVKTVNTSADVANQPDAVLESPASEAGNPVTDTGRSD